MLSRRKIIPLGKSSLVLTLPREWTRKNNLNRGDMLDVLIQKDQSLLIRPEYTEKHRENEISLILEANEPTNSITRIVIGCYLNGYDLIKLKSTKIFSTSQQQAIREIVKTLYLRIIESNSSKVTIQTLMDESKASLSSGISRMHIITGAMCDDVLNSMRYWDVDVARSVLNLEDDVDQFLFYLLRLIRGSLIDPPLASQLQLELVDCLDWQTLIYRIEHVADYTAKIAQSIIELDSFKIELPKNIWSALIKAAEIAFESYKQSVDHFLSATIDHSNRLIDNQNKIKEIVEEITPLPLMGIDDRDTFFHLFTIRENIQRIGESAADIAELTIDRAYKPGTT
ncbi:PhoU domain-containing protein [Thermoproteota archaeon]